jgi:hypothetical protein
MLRDVLAEAKPDARDKRLLALETCAGLPVGFVRTLRADLDPECGEKLAGPLLGSPPPGISSELMAALAGIAHAARFARAVTPMPVLAGSRADQIDRFLEARAKPWVEEQSAKLRSLEQAADVPRGSYGGALVRIADASAWAMLHRSSRSTPIPEQVKKSVDARQRYYGGLDLLIAGAAEQARSVSALAASEVAEQGDSSSRVSDWLRSLEALPGTQRLRTLWQVVLPHPSPLDPGPSGIEPLLPAFYAGLVVEPGAVQDPRRLRGLIEQGLSPEHRRALREAPLTREQRWLLGFHDVFVGLRTLDTRVLGEAVRVLGEGAPSTGPPALWLAIATAIASAPDRRGLEGWLSTSATEGARLDTRLLQDLARASSGSFKALVLIDGFQLELAELGGGDPFPRTWMDELGTVNVATDDPFRPCLDERLGVWGPVGSRRQCPFASLP